MKSKRSSRASRVSPLEQLESRTLLTATVFTLNPALSSLTNSGSAIGYDLIQQAAGSLTTSFSGTIGANVVPGSITFTGNSTITAGLNADKVILPGSTTANFGGKATTSFGDADVALRSIVANLTSGAITVASSGSFPSSGQTIKLTKGEVDYLAPFVGSGAKSIVGLTSKNTGAASTLVTSGTVETLTIPVKMVLTYSLLTTGDSTLTLTGKLVATAKVPVPTTITGNVFKDVNGDGKKETGDANFATTPLVTLTTLVNGKPSTTKVTTHTDASGNYIFKNVKPSITYRVSESVAGYRVTTPVGGFSDVRVGATVNFGDTQTVKISGFVFNDVNNDHLYEKATEANLAGFTVWVDVNHDNKFDTGDVSSTTATFSFVLKAGKYVVHINPKTGYTETVPTSKIYTENLTATGSTVIGLKFGEHKA